MSWHFLPELVEACSGGSSRGSTPSARWRRSPRLGKCSSDARGTVCYRCSRSGTTRGPSTDDLGMGWLGLSPRGSPVSPSLAPAGGRRPETSETSGPRPRASFARYDRGGRSWRTSQDFLGAMGTSDAYSGSWPRAGSMRSGIAFQLPPSARLTRGTASGSWPTPRASEWKGGGYQVDRKGNVNLTLAGAVRLWPTPTAGDAKGGSGHLCGTKRDRWHPSLRVAVKLWPTPLKRDARSVKWAKRAKGSEGGEPLVTAVGGNLNPTWVEWLMGWPIGWTAFEPLAKARFRQWRRSHGGFSTSASRKESECGQRR